MPRPPGYTRTDTHVPYTTLFRSFLGVHASVAQCRKGADAVGGVHVLALEVLRERQFDGLFLGADLDGEGVAVLDPLALRQFLEAPIAPPSGEHIEQALVLVGDKVMHQAVRGNVVGHRFHGGRLHAPLIERGKAKLRELDGGETPEETTVSCGVGGGERVSVRGLPARRTRLMRGTRRRLPGPRRIVDRRTRGRLWRRGCRLDRKSVV